MSPANLVREEAKDKAAHGEAEHETGRGQTDPDLSYEGLNCGSSRCILRLYNLLRSVANHVKLSEKSRLHRHGAVGKAGSSSTGLDLTCHSLVTRNHLKRKSTFEVTCCRQDPLALNDGL